MNTLESMKEALRPIGIYDLKKSGNVYKELRVYASELDRLYEKALEILEEGFCETAEDWGLDRQERLWGAVREEFPPQKRREMLIARSTFGYDDFSPGGVEKLLRLLGIEGEILEYPKVYRLTVDLRGENFTKAQRKFISSQFGSLFPAHIEADPIFSGFSFKDSDENALTFAQIENKGMRWADVDIYCPD